MLEAHLGEGVVTYLDGAFRIDDQAVRAHLDRAMHARARAEGFRCSCRKCPTGSVVTALPAVRPARQPWELKEAA